VLCDLEREIILRTDARKPTQGAGQRQKGNL
jgi:hypothetical protein